MTIKAIPVLGEPYLGDEPAPVRVLKVTWGVSTATVDVTYTSDTAAAAVDDLVELNSTNIDILDIGWFVEEAFTASAAATLGVSTDADAFGIAGDVGSTTVDTFIQWMSGLAGLTTDLPAALPASVQGYRPAAADSTDTANAIAGTGGAVTIAAGKMAVYVKYIKHSN